MSLGGPLALLVLLLVFAAVSRSRSQGRPPRVLERLDVDATEVRVVALVEERLPIADVRAVRFDDELLELALARGATRWFRVPPERVEHVHACVARLSAAIGRPALPIVAATHDGVRLNLDPVLSPVGPFLAPFAAGGSALLVAAAGVGFVVLPHTSGHPPSDDADLFGMGPVLGVLAFGLGAAQDLRVELALEGRRLVLRRENRWWRSERSIPLADVRGVRVSGHRLVVMGPGRPLRIPLGQRTAATEAVVRRFVREQVERARVLQGPVPADMARLVDRADCE